MTGPNEQRVREAMNKVECPNCMLTISPVEKVALELAQALDRAEAESNDANARFDKLDQWRRDSNHWCACEMDVHGAVCDVHAPKVQELQVALDRVTALAKDPSRIYAYTLGGLNLPTEFVSLEELRRALEGK